MTLVQVIFVFPAPIALALMINSLLSDRMLPGGASLDAYKVVLSGGVVTKALVVSIGVTVVGTVVSLVATAMLAYGLSRPGSFGSRPALLLVLFSLLFSPGLTPTYLTVRGLGRIDTYAALILPGLVSGFNVIVLRGRSS